MKTKLTRNKIALYFLTFITAFIILFIFIFSLFRCAQNFFEIDVVKSFILTIIDSLFLSLVYVICVTVQELNGKKSAIGSWISQNYPNLLTAYWILLFFLVSVSDTAIWNAEQATNLLTLEWTIFGFSLAIFLVWNVLMTDYYKKNQPASSEGFDPSEKYTYLLRKHAFSQEVEESFSTIVLMSINLLLLILSTSLTYISNLPESVFTQNTICCTFFFSTNTIAKLFFDILKPVKKEHDSLKATNQVTKEELDKAKASVLIHELFQALIDTVSDSKDLTDEEKKEVLRKYFEELSEELQSRKKESNHVKDRNQEPEVAYKE